MEKKTLSIMLTYRCNASCADCGTFSSPNDKSNVDLPAVTRIIDEAYELGFENVVFTGGEATLRWDDLIAAIRHATDRRFPSRLVTNAQWASNVESADLHAGQLILAGLKEINFSTGDEHVKYIPLDNIVNAVVSSVGHGLRVVVMIEIRSNPKITRAVVEREIDKRLPGILSDTKLSFIESPWMPSSGFRHGGHPVDLGANKDNIAVRRGCDSVLQTYVLQGNGVIASCCGLGMRRVAELQHKKFGQSGDLKEAVLESTSDLVKLALRFIGPERMLDWAARKDNTIEWENMYAHRCHACMRIYQDVAVRSVIKKHIVELAPDIVFARYSDEELVPRVFAPAKH